MNVKSWEEDLIRWEAHRVHYFNMSIVHLWIGKNSSLTVGIRSEKQWCNPLKTDTHRKVQPPFGQTALALLWMKWARSPRTVGTHYFSVCGCSVLEDSDLLPHIQPSSFLSSGKTECIFSECSFVYIFFLHPWNCQNSKKKYVVLSSHRSCFKGLHYSVKCSCI